ncbi:hypothetical protein J6S88_01880 [bacterium]|nr:hypothetical protein [bacterium]
MKKEFGEKTSNLQDTLLLASNEIIFDKNLKFFRVALPDGAEFGVSIDRFLDIF